MKYAFIQRHRRVWPISVQCRVLQVSAAGYHEHFVRRASDAQRRHLSDDALLVHIKAIHAETHGGYGWPRFWKEFLARGIRVSPMPMKATTTKISLRDGPPGSKNCAIPRLANSPLRPLGSQVHGTRPMRGVLVNLVAQAAPLRVRTARTPHLRAA